MDKEKKNKAIFCVKKIQNLSKVGLVNLIKLINDNPTLSCTKLIKAFKKGWKPVNRNTKLYWEQRGWNDVESTVRSSPSFSNRKSSGKSPFNKEFWLSKINPRTGIFFNEEEAQYEANKRRPIRMEYWLEKGYDEETSKELAYKTKIKNNKKGSEVSKFRDKKIHRYFSKRCVEYWLLKGYDVRNAIEKIAKEQSTFSMKKCIETYGPIDGYKRWKERQEKWQKTLNNKSDEEKLKILRDKSKRYNIQTESCLYLIKLKVKEKNFIKIGITSKSLNERFKHFDFVPLELYEFESLEEARIVENSILDKFKNYIQSDFFDFVGYSECFDDNINLDILKESIENEMSNIRYS